MVALQLLKSTDFSKSAYYYLIDSSFAESVDMVVLQKNVKYTDG